MKAKLVKLMAAWMSLALLVGCGANGNADARADAEAAAYIDCAELEMTELEDEAVALSESPVAVPVTILAAEASGKLVKRSGRAVIDYSNTGDGYVMVCFNAATEKRLKAQVKGPSTTYTYNIVQGEWTVFPLSDGNGAYQIKVYENIKDNKYSLETSVEVNVTLKDEFAPFLRPNQYVDYDAASKVVAKAAELTKDQTDALKKVETVYDFVVSNLSYDKEKAATVKSGYLPDLDAVLESKKGICFDYASLMTGMLRSQGVPCKLVIGYAGSMYHAWINVWSPETGWVDGAVYFDGTTWKRLDPTYASTGEKSQTVMDFIGNDANYTVKYIY